MKRYNITAVPVEGKLPGQLLARPRIKIKQADNGEWVRYEDVKDLEEMLLARIVTESGL